MYKIYRVTWSEHARSIFKDNEGFNPDAIMHTYHPDRKYYTILGEIETPWMIEFVSSYRGQADYKAANRRETVYFSHRYMTEEYYYAPGKTMWNFTPEDFEKEINGALDIAHQTAGRPLPTELFQAFKYLCPTSRNGYYELDTKTWHLVS